MNGLGQRDRPVFSIEVRDRRNPERLLGTLVKKPMDKLVGQSLKVAVMRRPEPLRSSYEPAALKPVFATTITFDIAYRPSWDHFSQAAELLTDNPLEDLLHLPTFRLPGEDERAAGYRLGTF